MGAWGEGPFENDDAADWSGEFDGASQSDGLRTIRETLSHAADSSVDDYLDAPEGSSAVAAAAVVAMINGHAVDRSPYSETVIAWVERSRPQPDPQLRDLARRALQRVLGANSEVAALWRDTDSSQSWRGVVEAILATL